MSRLADSIDQVPSPTTEGKCPVATPKTVKYSPPPPTQNLFCPHMSSSKGEVDAKEMEDMREKLARMEQKLNKKRDQLKQATDHIRHMDMRLEKAELRMDDREKVMSDKIEKAKKKLGDRVQKEEQVKNLSDIIRISLQQGRIEMAGKRVTRSALMRERLSKLADMLVELFGGYVFIAPLDIAENAALNSASGKAGRRFLTYIWSNTAKKALVQMGSDPSSSPMLDRAPIFQYVLDSRMWYMPELKLLSLPAHHFKMDKALIIPIVVDGKSLGLVGLANGRFSSDDARVLFESLPMAWLTVISEAVKTSSSLLSNTLPAPILERLMNNSSNRVSDTNRGQLTVVQNNLIADKHEEATILFCDIVGFTAMARNKSPEKLVAFLNDFFSMIDDLVDSYELEKIKTIGDCYMVAGGLPIPRRDHLERVADFALELLQSVHDFNEVEHTQIQVRIGMHCGPVVAGVIGRSKFTYDVWGDTVNYASRMESSGVSGRIHVTEDVVNRLKGLPSYSFEERSQVKIHGIGLVNSYFLGPALQKSVSLPKVPLVLVDKSTNKIVTSSSKTEGLKNNKIERAISTPNHVSHHVSEKPLKKGSPPVSSSALPKLI